MNDNRQPEGHSVETSAARPLAPGDLQAREKAGSAPVTMRRVLLWVGLVLSGITVLAGLPPLFLGFDILSEAHRSYETYYALGGFCVGIPLVAVGAIGVWACFKRLNDDYPQTGELPSQMSAAPGPDLAAVQARAAAGLCPKCGSAVAPADQNCPACRVNLAWAREHLDELAEPGS